MKKKSLLIPALVLVFVVLERGQACGQTNQWKLTEPVFLPGPQHSFSEIAVKDPSIVFYQGMWHLFFTARSHEEYTTGYASAKNLTALRTAPHHELKMIRGTSRYACAPQIFFFEPHQRWYLLFQTKDANYQPAYSTTPTIEDPESWSPPAPLLKKDSAEKWIDFWIICDRTKAYLFYTQAHHQVMVRTTRLEDFPHQWSESQAVFDGVHEAVHIYSVKNRNQYHMIYEINKNNIRSFGLATASNLSGPWKYLTDQYATVEQIQDPQNKSLWTDMISHGEAIRTGFTQNLEYDPTHCQWLIQGITKDTIHLPYPQLPWKLGILSKISGENP